MELCDLRAEIQEKAFHFWDEIYAQYGAKQRNEICKKNITKLFGIIAIVEAIAFSFIACDGNGGEDTGSPNIQLIEYEFSITSSSPSPTSICIIWETEAAIQSYKIFRHAADTEEYEYLAVINNNNSYLDTGLQPSTRYSYKIAYVDKNNDERFIGDDFFAVTSPHLIAHRGYWDIEGSAENSIKSLQMAAELGVYGSEFDIHLTADNIPVVYHDYGIRDTDIRIQEAPYNAIENVVLSNGERLPTLDDYLEIAETLSIQLILELKLHTTPERDREAAQIIVDKVRTFGLENKVEYITFSPDAGKELIRLSPDSKVGYLETDLTPHELSQYGFYISSYPQLFWQQHPEYFNDSRNLGLITNVWTVNNISYIESFVNYGINYITTDIPHQANEYFKNKIYKYSFKLSIQKSQ